MLFNNTFLCIRGDIFGLMGKYFDRSKTRHDWAKIIIGLAGQHDWPPFKNYVEPWMSKYLFIWKLKQLYVLLRFYITCDIWKCFQITHAFKARAILKEFPNILHSVNP